MQLYDKKQIIQLQNSEGVSYTKIDSEIAHINERLVSLYKNLYSKNFCTFSPKNWLNLNEKAFVAKIGFNKNWLIIYSDSMAMWCIKSIDDLSENQIIEYASYINILQSTDVIKKDFLPEDLLNSRFERIEIN